MTDAPTVVPPGGGEVVGDTPVRRVEILAEDDALHATWTRFGPRRDGADLHVHRRHTDVFYVLAGELTLRLGPRGDEVVVPVGTLARMPPLVVHGFRNAADAELRYLNLHAPGRGFADYLRALRDGRTLVYDQEPPPADGGRPVSEAAVGGNAVLATCAGARLALLADVEEIGIAEVSVGPGDPPPAHVHRDHLECLYVLAGELVVTSAGRELRAPAGSCVRLAPGVPHAVSCRGAEPARALDVHAPGRGFGAYVRAFRDTADATEAAARAGFDRGSAP